MKTSKNKIYFIQRVIGASQVKCSMTELEAKRVALTHYSVRSAKRVLIDAETMRFSTVADSSGEIAPQKPTSMDYEMATNEQIAQMQKAYAEKMAALRQEVEAAEAAEKVSDQTV